MQKRYCKNCGFNGTSEDIRRYRGRGSMTVYLCGRCAFSFGFDMEEDEEGLNYDPKYFGLDGDDE